MHYQAISANITTLINGECISTEDQIQNIYDQLDGLIAVKGITESNVCFSACADLISVEFLAEELDRLYEEGRAVPVLKSCKALTEISFPNMKTFNPNMLEDCLYIMLLDLSSVTKIDNIEHLVNIKPMFLDMRSYEDAQIPNLKLNMQSIVIANEKNIDQWRAKYPRSHVVIYKDNEYYNAYNENLTRLIKPIYEAILENVKGRYGKKNNPHAMMIWARRDFDGPYHNQLIRDMYKDIVIDVIRRSGKLAENGEFPPVIVNNTNSQLTVQQYINKIVNRLCMRDYKKIWHENLDAVIHDASCLLDECLASAPYGNWWVSDSYKRRDEKQDIDSLNNSTYLVSGVRINNDRRDVA